ncbi:hypothetical protein ASPBRDRAFT_304599 [Aspergillus brasiliensis CBS 101740]|uniref:Uncharacterized protein n=1 Tax=Aspergillus brasiliensis (strain CBS 101740 / IMI 381727 / IBT 21946) TaxID=767769 RepID=A0A1L9UA16_ASPBC|nr:hypothetical protein ASPBRDRAFT_304599 [Aspergillus brasiliensis CBS 101740]
MQRDYYYFYPLHRPQLTTVCFVSCVWEFCSPELDFLRGHCCRSLVPDRKLGPPRLRNRTKAPEKPLGIGISFFAIIFPPFPCPDIIPSSSASSLRRLISLLPSSLSLS